MVERGVFDRLIVDLVFILVQNVRNPGFQNTSPGCQNTNPAYQNTNPGFQNINTILLTSPSPSCTGTHLNISVEHMQPRKVKIVFSIHIRICQFGANGQQFFRYVHYQIMMVIGYQVFPRVSSSCFAPRKLTVPRPCENLNKHFCSFFGS